ncbi:MAG: hypothetical protein A3G33_07320 [Omnitrophica bacterium RIFCSPLOWO2_12_FULL_44_17]|uniref:YutG/PgpA domain-containing protein n=1 Tax=Candidatus Danuiimicrobium aquiferis TaxID=1801832 RepID=A0A1G1KYW1_9BACT|nr:MAG: hypothetical protein A3B72_07620 [Omnitrophica bacterium RIFCSPHIGHO2_02_FULL_45_28]OGW89247.1 MAG: hypothetical protein A3E74_08295 [Omnitrophica bacterium RIFCSPHIGHO2_12_FULL_44_12]OGW98098.1 MAG: hypothetical protein A3G33_07320 [Omnitrophica bacterium RIFCSPLOWO2_12_FULL_44_17]OGX03588.1 MAG: hypothetical protein A3J12_02910 [Omnitrophica bacterium RIFCSPLOWO2_02_FULL_44_11]
MFFAALSRETKEKIAYQIATVFKIGYAKIAPGTWGSLSALPLVILFGMHQFILAAAFLLVSLAAIWAGTVVSSKEKDEDPGIVVIDEVCGMMMTFLWIPLGWQTILAGFVLFRLFDIWKPFPISLIERKFHKGYGIVLDDVFAGVYANIILQLLIHYAPL